MAAVGRGETLDLRLRIAWGGPAAGRWQGTVTVSSGQWSRPVMLGTIAGGVPSAAVDHARLVLYQYQPARHDGLDVQLACDPDATVSVRMAPVDRPADERQWQIPVRQLVDGELNEALDDRSTQLVISRAPGDRLRINPRRSSLVFEPGERWEFDVLPHLIESEGHPLHCRLRLLAGRSDRTIWSAQKQLPADAGGSLAGWNGINLPLPQEEGVYELHMTIGRRRIASPFVPSRPLAERRIQLVVVGSKRPADAPAGETPPQMVLELDPASPSWWERLPRWPTLPLARWLPGARSSTSHQATIRTVGERQWMELPAGGWQAYPLPIDQPGVAHEIAVEFPENRQQTLAISVVESHPEKGFTATDINSGVVVAGSGPDRAGGVGQHRVIIWPRTSEPVLLLANRSDQKPALYRTIRVRCFPGGLPAAERPAGGRQFFAYLDGPALTGAANRDSPGAPLIDDWQTFYDGCRQWVAYLRYAGYDGLALLAAGDGSSLYPSTLWYPTAQLDHGAWSQLGSDPVRKDVLELLFRLCDREGLTLVPLVRMNMPLPALERLVRDESDGATGILLINQYGRTWRERHESPEGTGALYNPLDPRVQSAMCDVIRELTGRYRHHAAFGGILLDLDAGGYAQLPDRDWGLDPHTVARFWNDQAAAGGEAGDAGSGGDVAGKLHPAALQQVLAPPTLPAWLQWRSKQLAALYRRMHEVLVQQRFDSRLYLGLGGLVDAEPIRRSLQPMLAPIQGVDRGVLLDMGIDFRSLAGLGNLVILRPRCYAPSWGIAEKGVYLELNRHRGIDESLSSGELGKLVAGDLLLHPVDPVQVGPPEGGERDGPVRMPMTIPSVFSPAGIAYNGRLAESLGRRDVQVIFDGGTLLPTGQHHVAKAWLDTFRRLPPDPFESVETDDRKSGPVVARWVNAADRTYAYLVNQAPWPVDARVDLVVPFGTTMTSLHSRPIGPLEFGRGGAVWNVTLEPYELVAVELDAPQAAIRGVQTFVGSQVAMQLRERMETISNRLASLESQGFRQPYVGLENASFEQTGEGEPVVGWTVSSASVSVISPPDGVAPDGRRLLRLASDGTLAWVASDPIAPPASGQLTVVARIRMPDSQSKLIMGIDGRYRGEPFQRMDEVPDSTGGQWQEVVFPVKPLPARDLEDLRITFDLVGRGEVWIDDLRLYDVYLSAQERKHLITRITGPASYLLQEERWSECAQVLDGYWPRLLVDQVAPYERQMAELPERPASQPAARRPDSWWDRARRLLPRWGGG